MISRMNSGGTATYLNTLIPALINNGIEARLIFGNVAKGETEDVQLEQSLYSRLSDLNRSLSPIGDLRSTLELKNHIKEFSPHVVHSHAFKAGLISRLQFGGQSKRVHTFHGHHLYDPEFSKVEVGVMNFLERVLSKRTDGLVYVGRQVQEELQSIGIGKNVPSISAPPGIELPALAQKSEALDALGLSGIKNDQLTVLWMGRFVDVKRPEEFITLARHFRDVIFLMAGDGPLKSELEMSAPANVKFLGWKRREDLLAASDLVISTSRSEGMPLSLIEAQMAGLPVIAPNVGSVSEVIENEVTGLLVEVTLGELPAKLRRLIENEDLRLAMSKKASERAHRNFGVDSLVSSHVAFYERILNS